MRAVFEHCHENEVPSAAVQRALGGVSSRVPRPDAVDIVVTRRFEKSVEARRADGDHESEYTRDRMFGWVGAKTITGPDGRAEIIVDADDLAGGLPPVLLDRLFAHEALHAAINQRGENLSDLRERHGLPELSRAGTWAAVAGYAAEEYRVERALCDEGLGPIAGYEITVADALESFRTAILDGITLRFPNEPIDRCCETVLTAFHRVTILFAYVAGEELAGTRSVTERSSALWRRLVGSQYTRFREHLNDLPSANEPTARVRLDATISNS